MERMRLAGRKWRINQNYDIDTHDISCSTDNIEKCSLYAKSRACIHKEDVILR